MPTFDRRECPYESELRLLANDLLFAMNDHELEPPPPGLISPSGWMLWLCDIAFRSRMRGIKRLAAEHPQIPQLLSTIGKKIRMYGDELVSREQRRRRAEASRAPASAPTSDVQPRSRRDPGA